MATTTSGKTGLFAFDPARCNAMSDGGTEGNGGAMAGLLPIEECQTSAVDLFAEGIDRVEAIGGDNVRFVFWRWKYDDGRWSRVAIDAAVILPRNAVPAELLGSIRTVRPPQRPALTVSATCQ